MWKSNTLIFPEITYLHALKKCENVNNTVKYLKASGALRLALDFPPPPPSLLPT